MAFDSLSVTTRFFVDSGGYWESYMVMGSPYITIKYQDSTPNIQALSTFSDVTCPFDSQGQYKDGSGFDSLRRRTAAYKWGVCTPYDPLSVSFAFVLVCFIMRMYTSLILSSFVRFLLVKLRAMMEAKDWRYLMVFSSYCKLKKA